MEVEHLILILAGLVGLSDEWNYLDETDWPGLCKNGQKQSPINIVTNNAIVDMKSERILGPLVFLGYKAVDVTAVNTGHALQWDAVPGGPVPVLSGGPLGANYSFVQLHLHWMSEHAIDGVKFPLEIHFVHTKHGLTFDEALIRPDGLAVIGVLVNVQYGAGAEHAFEELMTVVPDLVEPNQTPSNSADIVDLTRLFSPDPESYYTYQGSLTTPECQETVTWIVMDRPLVISDSQYKILTKVDIGGVNNFRSLQAPTDRLVYHSMTSCASMLAPGLAIFNALHLCAYAAMSSLSGFVKRVACYAANLKRKIAGLKAAEC